MTQLRTTSLLVLFFTCMVSNAQDHYLFAYFRDPGSSGVFFATSEDGYQWAEANGGKPVVTPAMPDQLMRDPFIAKGPDGVYHMVWTWGWRGSRMGHASSKDLVQWSSQDDLPVMAGIDGVKNVWAPEIAWNKVLKEWVIFWATTIDGRFTETMGQVDSGLNHRMYAMTTPDFKSFSEPKLWFNPGYAVIDSTLFEDGSIFRMVFKDERSQPLRKQLLWAKGPSPMGPWTVVGDAFTESWSEGPSVLRIGQQYIVYYERYKDPKGYKAVASQDWKQWSDISSKLSFPQGAKHGSFLRISQVEAKRVKELK